MYLVYIDESRRNCEDMVVLSGVVVKDVFVSRLDDIFAEVVSNEVSAAIRGHAMGPDSLDYAETWVNDRRYLSDLIIHMKDFVNERDALRKMLKNIGIVPDQITEIKRRILFGVVEGLGRANREEVFAVAARVEKRLPVDLKYRLALKFVLERAAMNVRRGEPILVVFDTPGKDFRADEIYDAYRRWLDEGVIDDGDTRPSFSDLRARYFDEVLTSREGDRVHRGLQVADIIAWTIGRMDYVDAGNSTSPCLLRRPGKKDLEYKTVELCNTILNRLFIRSGDKIVTLKIY